MHQSTAQNVVRTATIVHKDLHITTKLPLNNWMLLLSIDIQHTWYNNSKMQVEIPIDTIAIYRTAVTREFGEAWKLCQAWRIPTIHVFIFLQQSAGFSCQ